MQAPRYLRSGDKVAIISTARKISEEEVQAAVDKFQSWGLEVIKGKFLHAQHHQFAGTEEQRAFDLQKTLNDSSIRAIFCARGGYGTIQIIDKIDWSSFRRNPKWIVGYSDITVLHSHINRNCGIETIHATMPINFSGNRIDNNSISSLYSALFKGKNSYEFPSHPFNREGIVQAPIVGGNLSILYSLLGSKSDVSTDNSILFLEDLDEYLYHIDRMMMNLERNSKFKHIKALLIGGMNDMNDNTIPYGQNAEEIIHQIASKYKFPIAFNFPAGHISDNRAIILGRDTVLEISKGSSSFFQL